MKMFLKFVVSPYKIWGKPLLKNIQKSKCLDQVFTFDKSSIVFCPHDDKTF